MRINAWFHELMLGLSRAARKLVREQPNVVMDHGIEETLQQVGKKLGGKLSNALLYDANVCTYISSPDRPWELVCVSGSPLTKSLHARHRDRAVRIFANNDYTSIEVKGPISIGVFSVNLPNSVDPSLSQRGELKVEGRVYATFRRQGDSDALTSVESDIVSRLLVVLQLNDGESLQFHQGATNAYLKSPHAARIIAVVEAMIDSVSQHQVEDNELRLEALPVQFHPITHLVLKWSVSDDDERQQLLADSSKDTLSTLVATVEPYLAPIDSYLHSLGENPSAEACALGTLAECVVEAKMLLEAGGPLARDNC